MPRATRDRASAGYPGQVHRRSEDRCRGCFTDSARQCCSPGRTASLVVSLLAQAITVTVPDNATQIAGRHPTPLATRSPRTVERMWYDWSVTVSAIGNRSFNVRPNIQAYVWGISSAEQVGGSPHVGPVATYI